jgi:hypothetical protein
MAIYLAQWAGLVKEVIGNEPFFLPVCPFHLQLVETGLWGKMYVTG